MFVPGGAGQLEAQLYRVGERVQLNPRRPRQVLEPILRRKVYKTQIVMLAPQDCDTLLVLEPILRGKVYKAQICDVSPTGPLRNVSER